MSNSLSRRRVLTAGAGAALGLGVLAATSGPASAAAAGYAGPGEETKSLDELYQDAIAEGGKLVVYAGGDVSSQADGIRAAFKQRFPAIDFVAVVDYSKFHDVRVDNQLATGTLVPDVVQLQTLQDFDRWNAQGHLLRYKPAGFSKLHRDFRDPQGAWVAVAVIGFSYSFSTAALGSAGPKTPRELVDPAWAGRIASSYPNDDDAVLFLYSRYAQAYGWDWVAKLAAQNMQFARGTNWPGEAVNSGRKPVGVGGSGSTLSGSSTVKWVLPDSDPFMAWGQRAAILKQAKHPAAAKLYLNWSLSLERQQAAFNGWSVRTDVTPPAGLKPVWQYPNAHVAEFPRFMADRAEVERWRQTFTLYFGEVQGAPSPGWLGLHPGA
ncbi:ABC transporter substrate-binding protein [Amycolatopsis sp. NPDC005003]